MAWGIVASAGATLVGGMMQSNAASDAASAQSQSSANAIGEQRRQYDLQRSDTAPYRATGTNALRRLAAYYGIPDTSSGNGQSEADIRSMLAPQYTNKGTPIYDDSNMPDHGWGAATRPISGYQGGSVDQTGLDAAVRDKMQQQGPATPQVYNDELTQPLQMDPGYQFGLNQGQQAIDRKTAAAGGRISGASLKAANEYATNYATTGYNAAYQRRQDRLNRLSELAGIGQTSTNASAAAGANSTNAISGLLERQGDAAGAGRLAQGNIWGGAVNQLGATAKKWATSYDGAQPSSYRPGPLDSEWAF